METFDETPFDETDLALWGIGKREQLALGLRRGGGTVNSSALFTNIVLSHS